jgi:GntR family transcriptional regulator
VLARATAAERKALRLPANARVIRFDRIRTHNRRAFITESVILAEAMFPGLADYDEIPDTFYDTFQKNYGVLVTRTEERLTAVAAEPRQARELEVPPGTPLMRIERIAFTLDDRPVEWRISLCRLKRAHYLARTG